MIFKITNRNILNIEFIFIFVLLIKDDKVNFYPISVGLYSIYIEVRKTYKRLKKKSN